jgi:hypothetical protein
MEITELIAALGGARSLSGRLGLKASAVGMWAVRGAIPREHHLALWQMALAAGLPWQPPGAEAIRAQLAATPPARERVA